MDGIQSFPEIVKLLIENGLQATLTLFFLTLIFGLILGMIIAKGRMSKLLIIQMPIRFFLLIMRGTPLILQLYGFYFGLYYIAGLSLDIPVLIGAKHALDVLKSSAYVELDCENGLVTAN